MTPHETTNGDDPDEGVSTTTTTTKRFESLDARFGTEPDEIHVELRVGSPAYVRLRPGKYLQEGDAFRRDQLGMDSPVLGTWEVREITPERVVGTDPQDGSETEWSREEVEKGLAVGRYSTNLTDFERVSTYEVGSWDEFDPDDDDDGPRYTGRPYVAVVAYGDNGLKYGRRYRYADRDSTELVLWTRDVPRSGFPDGVAERLDRRVHDALEAEGYEVVESDQSGA